MHHVQSRAIPRAFSMTCRRRIMTVAVSHALLAIAAVGIAGQPLSAQAQTQPSAEQRRQYAIPAGPLEGALVRFAQESGVMISYGAADVAGRQSPGVSGSYTAGEALRSLFRGTGLQPVAQPNGGYTLQQALPEEATLPAVQVSGAVETDGTAETGYRTNKVSGVGPWQGRSLQDTPYSVTVIPTELIENLQATTADQLYRVNPTTQLTWPQAQNDTPYVYMRGFLSTTPARNGLPGAMYGHGTSTEDVERIEILTGLSGFLYGTGNVGGLINYVSKRPTAERYNSITTGYTGGSNGYIHGDFGGPIDAEGRFGYRINAVVQDGETTINDFSIKKNFLSAAFDWKVTDKLLVQVDGSYRDYDSQRQAYWALATGAVRPSADRLDPDSLWSQKWTFFDVESKRLGTNIKWEASDNVTLRASWLKRRDTRAYSFSTNTIQPDGSYNQSNVIAAPQDMQGEAWNAFADFSFKTGAVSHKLTAGHLATRVTRYDHIDGSSTAPLRTGLSLDAPSYIDEPAWAPHGQLPNWNSSISRQSNWIVGDDITFNEQWSMLVGLNRSTIDNSRRSSPSDSWQSSYKMSKTTPTISLLYKPVPHVTTYATYMESLEQGGVAPDFDRDGRPLVNAGEVMGPLVSKQVEAGIKATVGGMQLAAALFEIDKGLEYTDPSAQPVYVQDGRQVHRGIELTATGKVSRDWTLVGGLTLLDAKVKEQKQNPALEGKRPTGTAKQFFKLYGEYQVPGVQGLTLSGGFNRVGAAWADTMNTDRLPGYTVFDVGARYVMAAGGYPLTLRLNVNNLTDKRYWVNNSFLGDARVIVLSANLKF